MSKPLCIGSLEHKKINPEVWFFLKDANELQNNILKAYSESDMKEMAPEDYRLIIVRRQKKSIRPRIKELEKKYPNGKPLFKVVTANAISQVHHWIEENFIENRNHSSIELREDLDLKKVAETKPDIIILIKLSEEDKENQQKEKKITQEATASSTQEEKKSTKGGKNSTQEEKKSTKGGKNSTQEEKKSTQEEKNAPEEKKNEEMKKNEEWEFGFLRKK